MFLTLLFLRLGFDISSESQVDANRAIFYIALSVLSEACSFQTNVRRAQVEVNIVQETYFNREPITNLGFSF